MNSKKRNDNYILVTPVKDEENDLPSLIASVAGQNKKPILWVIVNDGSTDQSPEIIKKACENYDWIKTINLPPRKRDIGVGYSFVCRSGFNYLLGYCKKNDISYGFIGLLDADIVLESNYFKELIRYFINDNKLGIISGNVWSFNGKSFVMAKGRLDEPVGAARFWRKACFEQTDGYLLTYAPDDVSNIKARLKGWETKIFPELKIKQTRMTSSAEGLWKGYKVKGESDYFLHKPMTTVIIRMITFFGQNKPYLALAYFSGYLQSFVNKKKRILDMEVINYYHASHLKHVIITIIKNKDN